MMYKLYCTQIGETVSNAAITTENGKTISFIFAPDNTDYQQFKLDLANGAQLMDADGNTMTTDQINTFLETLP